LIWDLDDNLREKPESSVPSLKRGGKRDLYSLHELVTPKARKTGGDRPGGSKVHGSRLPRF